MSEKIKIVNPEKAPRSSFLEIKPDVKFASQVAQRFSRTEKFTSMISSTTIKDNKFCFSFESLLGNLPVEEFVNTYWEQRTFYIERKDENFYSKVLTLGDVDKILDNHKPELGDLKVAKSSSFLSPDKYLNSEGKVKLNSVYGHYADGYSIVLKHIHQCWNPVNRLCFNLSKILSHKVKANMYLTPRNSYAYNPHIDTHDVIILQLSGAKNWQIYDTISETPLTESQGVSSINKDMLSGLKEYTLNAGDLIYIPRGVPHDAFTTDQSSLHLTIGIYPVQWADFLKATIGQIAIQDAAYRKALPFGFLNRPDIEKLAEQTKALLLKIPDQLDIDDLLLYYDNQQRIGHAPIIDGHFTHLDRIDQIELTTPLIRKKDIGCKVMDAGHGFVRLVYDGNTVKGPSKIRESFEFIAFAKEPFTPNSLPLHKPAHKLKLCKRLVRGGLLKIHK